MCLYQPRARCHELSELDEERFHQKVADIMAEGRPVIANYREREDDYGKTRHDVQLPCQVGHDDQRHPLEGVATKFVDERICRTVQPLRRINTDGVGFASLARRFLADRWNQIISDSSILEMRR